MANLQYIINVLRLYSSENKPLTIKQIHDYCKNIYDPVSNKSMSPSTTARILTRYLQNSIFLNDDPTITESEYTANFRIHIVHKNPNGEGYIDATQIISEMENDDTASLSDKPKKQPTAYYYYEPLIPIDTINTLISMVETHPYYTTEEVMQLTEHIKSIAPGYFDKHLFYPGNNEMRSNDSTLVENIHYLHQYISKGENVKIEYSYYDKDKNFQVHTGYPTIVTPYKIIWSNGYCYLIAYNPLRKNITHYRVDRITWIDDADQPIDNPYKENPAKDSLTYTKNHPVMMSGKTSSVSMLCKNTTSMVNLLLDSFGMNITIKTPTNKILTEVFKNGNIPNPDEWLDVRCPSTSPEGAVLWVKQHCSECILYKPVELSQRIKNELQQAADRY